MAEPLAPCPFCGAAAVRCENFTGLAMFWTQCGACHACPGGDHATREKADAAWNTRTRALGAAAWRPEVVAFANLMEAQLRANDHKPGWKRDYSGDLIRRLREETEQLAEGLDHAAMADYSDRGARVYHDPKQIAAKRTAHVANFAMMIADVCGALEVTSSGEA